MLGSPSTKNQSNFKARPSSSLFQIARGSEATLSECTFFFEKRARHQEDFFRTKLLQGIMTKRSRTELYPSSF